MKEFIDKLIERLENHMEYCKTCHEEFPNAKMSLTYEVQINAYKNAIEIVNQLAEEYNNDVCEWWHWRTINDIPMYRTTCLNEFSKNLTKKYKFCPHCGKKIKVAPYTEGE